MSKIQNTDNTICCWRCIAKGTFIHYQWECKMEPPHWETVCRFLKKIAILLSYNPAIVPLGIYPNELKTHPYKNLHMNVYSIFLHNLPNWRQPRCSSLGQWINKLWYNHLVLKRNDLSSYEKTQRDFKCILLHKRNQS